MATIVSATRYFTCFGMHMRGKKNVIIPSINANLNRAAFIDPLVESKKEFSS